jgi:hypothetical protein
MADLTIRAVDAAEKSVAVPVPIVSVSKGV